jgi:hypothetical protein
LARILEAFVAKELQPWVKTFTANNTFFRSIMSRKKMTAWDYERGRQLRRPYFLSHEAAKFPSASRDQFSHAVSSSEACAEDAQQYQQGREHGVAINL